MEVEKKPKASIFKNLDRSDFIALIALFISLGAFGVSLYEANILKSQQAMMQEQQRASVWPYLECSTKYTYDNNLVNIQVDIVNKGVGPAKVEQSTWWLQKQKIDDYSTFTTQLKSLLPSHLEYDLEYGSPDGILSPGDRQRVISIQGPRFVQDQSVFRKLDLQYQICYCSIYGDCWTLKDSSKKPTVGCE